jgi:hypothetical protein
MVVDMTVMILIAASSIGLFLLVFWLAGVVPSAKSAIAVTRDGMQAMRDADLNEAARERAVQAAAIRLVAVSGSLILRNLAALIAAFVPILVADWAGIVPQTAMLAFMGRWDVILIATVVVTLGFMVGVRVWSR